jgi:aminocarboxymuconate-semialdehyde decarboxylase
MKETERAINELGFKGVQVFTTTDNKPLDAPEFMPLYDLMANYDLPVWIHPERDVNFTDYPGETRSRYMIFHIFGWPYETSAAMTRLVFSGVFDKNPNLKFITHHCGGMVPYFEERIIGAYDHAEILRGAKYKENIRKQPIDYFKMFYNDTAIYGHTPGLMCGFAFSGADHIVFGTDFPYDSEMGDRYTRQTIASVERMDITDEEKEMIFEGNARRLLKL